MLDFSRQSGRRTARVAAALAVATLALSACGSNQSTTHSSATPTPSASASASMSASPSVSPSASATPTKAAKVITSLDAITVKGEAGKQPTVTAAWPIAIAKTQSKVLKAGSGRQVASGSTLSINYVGIDARTGKTFDSSFSRGQAATFSLSQVIAGFQKGLVGHKVGDRVLVMMPGSDGYDSSGGNAQAGILKGDSLIFVVDILDVAYTEASGTTVTPAAGLPTVTMKDGVPQLTIGKATKPSTLVVQPLIKGSGAKVTATDTLLVKYRSWAWSTGKVIDEGYTSAGIQGQLSSTISAWKKGLVGQTVGSRVLLIAPPSEAYPDGDPSASISKGETLVYVIDILMATKTS